jgi:hypothetical protein
MREIRVPDYQAAGYQKNGASGKLRIKIITGLEVKGEIRKIIKYSSFND